MRATDLTLLTRVAEEAGQIALEYFRKDPEVAYKDDKSPVSAADLAVNRMLEHRLRKARPDYGWLSEESPDEAARLEAERVFIVDPIDGTRAFVAGQSAFATAIAIAEAGEVISAVVHMPAQEKTYLASRGEGATLNGVAIQASARTALEGAEILSNKTALKPQNWARPLPQVTPHFRPSLAYRMCLVAEGRFDGAVTLRDAWEWDVAAGDLICREAGAIVTTGSGGTPRYNSPAASQPGLIAANPVLHAEFMAHLATTSQASNT